MWNPAAAQIDPCASERNAKNSATSTMFAIANGFVVGCTAAKNTETMITAGQAGSCEPVTCSM